MQELHPVFLIHHNPVFKHCLDSLPQPFVPILATFSNDLGKPRGQ